MIIGNICSRRIVTVDASSTPAQAAGLMRDHHVGALIVITRTGEGSLVSGVVTDRDLVIGALAGGLERADITVGDLARNELVSVAETDDVSSAIDVMHNSGVRRLLVTGPDQQLTGIVSLDDLIDACASDIDGLANIIRSGMEREVVEHSTPPLPSTSHIRIPAMGTAGWGQRGA